MGDTNKVLEIIKGEYKRINDKENTSNALDFIEEIISKLREEYNVDKEQEKKDKLYNEVKRRYDNLNNMCKRLQNEENGIDFESEEQDKIDLCAILDTFDGSYLE